LFLFEDFTSVSVSFGFGDFDFSLAWSFEGVCFLWDFEVKFNRGRFGNIFRGIGNIFRRIGKEVLERVGDGFDAHHYYVRGGKE
jgi:hypothetical protein